MTETRSLPIIDLSRFRDPDADRERFLAELRHAAHEIGFFYVTGYGVSTACGCSATWPTSGTYAVSRSTPHRRRTRSWIRTSSWPPA